MALFFRCFPSLGNSTKPPSTFVCLKWAGNASFAWINVYWLVVWNMFFIFHNIWDNPSNWLIFFKMVKITNQYIIIYIINEYDNYMYIYIYMYNMDLRECTNQIPAIPLRKPKTMNWWKSVAVSRRFTEPQSAPDSPQDVQDVFPARKLWGSW